MGALPAAHWLDIARSAIFPISMAVLLSMPLCQPADPLCRYSPSSSSSSAILPRSAFIIFLSPLGRAVVDICCGLLRYLRQSSISSLCRSQELSKTFVAGSRNGPLFSFHPFLQSFEVQRLLPSAPKDETSLFLVCANRTEMSLTPLHLEPMSPRIIPNPIAVLAISMPNLLSIYKS